MHTRPDSRSLEERINKIRVENSACKKFVPETELYEILSRESIAPLIGDFTPFHYAKEVVDFIVNNARKTFSILILINRIHYIGHFIKNDDFQARHIDDLLPFTKERLHHILEDDHMVEMFYERQWEFTAPMFLGQLVPRALSKYTILPFLAESHLAKGGYGSIYKTEIHPSHRPPNSTTTIFVRKELDLNDSTFDNEVQILATLQRLKHPNILQLIGCYTYSGKNNLISPFIAGGTLRRFFSRTQAGHISRENMLYSIAGLVSAIWALHEFVLGDAKPSHKGHHQDLSPDNILVDGDCFILADFGLSSIKSIDENSRTPFKGRRGYCQAPECADLASPYLEHETTRATDIFSLGCIIADLLVYFIRGPDGVKEFRDARRFKLPPMCYYTYHQGISSNNVVATWLDKVATEDGSQSIAEAVLLVIKMLKVLPHERPTAATTTGTMYMCTIKAYSERISVLFTGFASSTAQIERARFLSWLGCQDVELYSSSSGATRTARDFDSTIYLLRKILIELESINYNQKDLDSRSFLEINMLNTELLNILSTERRDLARSRFESIVLESIEPGKPSALNETIKIEFSESVISQKAETKHLVAQVEDTTISMAVNSFPIVVGPVKYIKKVGRYNIAKICDAQSGQNKSVFVETISYQDIFRKKRLLPRINSLCDLLSSKSLGSQLCVPPFCGIHDNTDASSFEILYEFPPNHAGTISRTNPIFLYDLLTEREIKNSPPLENRHKLALELVESLAAFHDVNWFHKDLTSLNILFFPTTHSFPLLRAERLYLVGFHHSRSAADDFTEGPLQDRRHQRYHHPEYISVENHAFKRFRPQFDYYSLGILLIEIGFWSTIDTIMSEHTLEDNHSFCDTLLREKLPTLSFWMGSQYTDVVRECLTGLGKRIGDEDEKNTSISISNLEFKNRVLVPLRKFNSFYDSQELERK